MILLLVGLTTTFWFDYFVKWMRKNKKKMKKKLEILNDLYMNGQSLIKIVGKFRTMTNDEQA